MSTKRVIKASKKIFSKCRIYGINYWMRYFNILFLLDIKTNLAQQISYVYAGVYYKCTNIMPVFI